MRNDFEASGAQDSGQDVDTDVSNEATPAKVTVRPDAIRVEVGPDGVVNLPAGVNAGDIVRVGTDLVVPLPDGGQMVIVNGALFVPQLVIGEAVIPPTTVAALLIQADPPAGPGDDNDPNNDSSGGNFAVIVPGLGPAQELGDLLPPTELFRPLEQQEEPGYFLENEPDIVIETPDNPAGARDATAGVDEAGLPARNGEPAGSNAAADSESVSGTFVYSSPDSPNVVAVDGLVVNGVVISAVGQVIQGQFGTLTITSISPGAIGFRYTLTDNTSGDSVQDIFSVTVTDVDGDSATANLTINITDDGPSARDDTDTIAARTYGPEDGNVFTGVGTTSGAAGADTPGADGAVLTAIAAGGASVAIGDGNVEIVGAYGTLTIAADGSYTYVRDPASPGGVEDVFTYTLTDGDGDTSTATLTIVIEDAGVDIDIIPDPNAGNTVDEGGLPPRNGETPGSGEIADGDPDNDSDPTEHVTGVIRWVDGDGVNVVAINGTPVTGAGQVIPIEGGIITIISYDPDANIIEYNFTLTDNTSGTTTTVTFTVTVTDVDGDTATDVVVIDIIDDEPIARDDSAVQPSEDANITVDIFANDTPGADGVDLATGVELVAGSLVGAGTLTYNGDGTFTYDPVPGEEGTVTFDYRITDSDGSPSVATVTIELLPDSTPSISIVEGSDTVVNEAGLNPDGSDAASNSEVGEGALTFDTGNDSVGSLVINGIDVTNGGSVPGAYGTLTISGNPTDGYTYSYELTTDLEDVDGVAETDDFNVVLTDSDGDTADTVLSIEIIDDLPKANNDSANQAAEDANITVDVFANDVAGADGVNLISGIAVVPGTLSGPGTLTYNNNGTFTYGPVPGEEGVVTFQYEITDGDGDTSVATVTITLLPDSTPSVSIAEGSDTVVDEAALDGPPNGDDEGSNAASNDEFAAGTIEFDTGNDTVASLVIGGVNVSNGGVVPGLYGTLTVIGNPTAGYTYSYELTTNTQDLVGVESDDFSVVLTDSDGDVASTSLSIEILDDTPTAEDDVDGDIVEGGATSTDGNVITGEGTNGGLNGVGADTPGADGAEVGNPGVYVGLYGTLTLNADGSYNYVMSQDGVALLETLTDGETLVDQFNYTLVDGDLDSDPAQLTIIMNGKDDPVVLNGVEGSAPNVFVDESNLPDGSNPSPSFLTQLWNFAFEAPDGVDDLTMGGVLVIEDGVFVGAGATIATPSGTITVTGFIPLTAPDGTIIGGTLLGNFVLEDNSLDNGPNPPSDPFESVPVNLTDEDGSSTSGVFLIEIVNDVPTANNDVDSDIFEGGPTTTTGNVITGDGTDGGVAGPGADTLGADGAQVGNPGFFVGLYGVLTLNADGSYEYLLSGEGIDALNALTDGESLVEEFSYTLLDNDGDSSPAFLTIIMDGENDPVVLNGLDGQGPELSVDEDDLPAGSDTTPESLVDGNSFSFEAADGVDDVWVGGVLIIENGVFLGAKTIADDYGELRITDFIPDTDLNGLVIGGTFIYEYELDANALLHGNAGEDPIIRSFEVKVTDQDVDMATGSLDVEIVDDVPTATLDMNNVSEGGSVGGNVFTNDVIGADGAAPGGPVTGVAAGSDTSNPVSGDVGVAVAGTYGTLTLNANGSYTYEADPNVGAVQDVFVYTITDGDGDTSTVTLTIDVADSGLAATNEDAAVFEAQLAEGSAPDAPETASGNLNDNVSGGAGGNSFALVGSGTGSNGTLVINPDGTWVYTLNSPVDGADADNGNNVVNNVETFTYEVTDADGNTTTSTITIDIVDDVPTAVVDSASVTEGASVMGNVVDNDTIGADGAEVADNEVTGVAAGNVAGPVSGNVGASVAGLYGTLTINADGSYTYESDPDAVAAPGATDTFTYTITDGDGDTSTATIDINVDDVTLVADNDTITVDEDGLDGIGSAGGTNSETAGGTLMVAGAVEYALVGSNVGSNGTLTLNNDGTYSYTLTTPVDGLTADNDENVVPGVDVFTYVATDADGNTVQGTITIDVRDDVPTATADVDSVTEGADTSGNVLPNDVLGADGAAPGGAVTGVAAGNDISNPVSGDVGVAVAGTYGTLTLNADGSYTYEADPNVGDVQDVFVYTITDGDGDTSTVTLTINVGDSNLAANNEDASVNEAELAIGSTPNAPEQASGNLNDNVSGGNGGNSFALVGSGTGSNGTLVINPDGTWVYTLNAPVDGADADNGATTENNVETFTYEVTDMDGNTTTSTITIDIVDDVPTAVVDSANVTEGASVMGNVVDNDTIGADFADVVDNEVTGVVAGNVAGPVSGNVGSPIVGAYGSLTINADGSYTYQSTADAISGDETDTFTYTITDGDGDTSTTTITINLADVTLVADNDTISVDEDGLDGIGSAGGTNSETAGGTLMVADAVNYAVVGSNVGSNGTLTLNSDGTYSYTLTSPVDGTTANNGENNVPAVDVFTYEATDANGNTVQGTITIDVIDDVPTANNDTVNQADQNGENTDVTVDVLANDVKGADGVADVDVALVGGSLTGAGNLVYNGDGTFTYSPAANEEGSVQFQYEITDGDGDKSIATVTINLEDDSNPTAFNVSAAVDDDGFGTGNSTNVDDIDADVGDSGAGLNDETVFVGSFGGTFGNDAPGTYSFAAMDGVVQDIGLETLTYSWDGGSNTLTATSGTRGDVFTVVIDQSTGEYTVTLLQNYLHDGGDDGEVADAIALLYTAIDSENEESAPAELTIVFGDDAPSDFAPDVAVSLDGDQPAVSNVALNIATGADLPGSYVFNITDGVMAQDTDGNLVGLAGQQLYLFGDGTGQIVATTDPTGVAGDVGFTVTLNGDGTYNFDVNGDLTNGTSTTFSDFGNVKAGNNDTLGIGIGDPVGAVARGSDGNTIGTVNTSKQGDGSIGVNNQSINVGEFLRIGFVTDLTSTPTGLQFTGRQQTTSYEQLVTQVQGNQAQTATFRVYAIDTDNDPADAPDTYPVDGLGPGESLVQITSVSVTDYNTGQTATLDITTLMVGQTASIGFGASATRNADGSVTFSGIQQGDTYAIETTAEFSAIIVQGVSGQPFDLSVFTIGTESAGTDIIQEFDVTYTDADGDTADGTVTTVVDQDGSGPPYENVSTTIDDASVSTGSLTLASFSKTALNDNGLSLQQSGLNSSLMVGGAMIAGMSMDYAMAGSFATASAPMLDAYTPMFDQSLSASFMQVTPITDGADFGLPGIEGGFGIAANPVFDGGLGGTALPQAGSLDAIQPMLEPDFAPLANDMAPVAGNDAGFPVFAANDMIAMPGADAMAALAANEAGLGHDLGNILSDALMGGDMDPVDAILANLGEGGLFGDGGLAAIAPLGDFASFNMGFEGGFTFATQDIMVMEAMVLHHDMVMSA
ncbi:Ig-like domain-containing protein [Sphingomicrobium marinum]|uniref:Ig-like domain-containing protein n=1 Tax=Sphingomicrobium marinum TaxID=1227950 RepID=UPI00223FC853|nr:Ig-like domain-containing protein [Sphingomicrobium marinum]